MIYPCMFYHDHQDGITVAVFVDHNVMTDNISCPTHFPKGKTERKVDSLNIYCETLCHNKVYMKNCSLSPTYSIPQNQVICTI